MSTGFDGLPAFWLGFDMEEGGIVEAYEVQYSDLILLSSSSSSGGVSLSLSAAELSRLESISTSIMEALGPSGPGLLAVTGVPNASTLRRSLLPLARKLALLNPQDRNRILKEHSLGSDVPLKNLDRSVSSFAMQLKYEQGSKSTQSGPSHKVNDSGSEEQDCNDVYGLSKIQNEEFKNLGSTFKDLGFRMMELGLHLARICDRAIGGEELEQSLLESCSAKGRLIHYHSTLDSLIIREMGRRKGFSKQKANHKRDQERPIRNEQTAAEFPNLGKTGDAGSYCCDPSNLWQQWHYDYGIFTVLTAPLFILPCHAQSTKMEDHFCKYCEQQCPSPSGHTYLQIFDPNKNNVLMVRASPDSFIVQVGESADILSKGKLRSTLHSVCRPGKLENLSRETFAVFLQPAWSKTFSISDYPMDHSVVSGQCDGIHCAGEEPGKLTREIHRIVPPLASRLKDEMTFAEFSRETTKQYYGGSGLQSKR